MTGEYNWNDAKEEAFDLLQEFLEEEKNHFETGQQCAEALVVVLMSRHIMPMDEPTACGIVKEFMQNHLYVVDLSQKLPEA